MVRPLYSCPSRVWVSLERVCLGWGYSLQLGWPLEGPTASPAAAVPSPLLKGALDGVATCLPYALSFEKHILCGRPVLGHVHVYCMTQFSQYFEVQVVFCILHKETWLMFVFPDENPAWGNISQVANHLEQPACLCRGREPAPYWEVSKIWIWCSAFNFLLYPRVIILLFLLSFPLSFEFIIFKICICWEKTSESYKECSILFLLRFLQRGGLSWPDRYKQIVLKNQSLLLWLVAPELLPCPLLYFSLVSNWMSQPHGTQRWLKNLLSDDLES